MKATKPLVGIFLFTFVGAVLSFIYFSYTGERADQPLKVGVFVYDMSDPFMATMIDGLNLLADDSALGSERRFYFNVNDAKRSQTTQNRQIERSLALDYDVLCVNLVDRTSAAYVIDKAMEADVPVVFFNREPVEADMKKWEHLYYVGTDAAMNGTMEGQIVVAAYQADPGAIDLNGDGAVQYIMIEGEFRHQDAVLRTKSSVRTILEAGIRLEKLDGGVANWSRDEAAALASGYFGRYGTQIELILCNNDDMALGVLDAVAANGAEFRNIVGVNGNQECLTAIDQQKMLGTVVIDAHAQAELIFAVTDALLDGRDPRQTITIMTDERIVRAPMYIVSGTT